MELDPRDLAGIPIQYQLYATWFLLACGLIGKALGALANGGGLKNILLRAWFGTSVPKPIAQDYKDELNKPKP